MCRHVPAPDCFSHVTQEEKLLIEHFELIACCEVKTKRIDETPVSEQAGVLTCK